MTEKNPFDSDDESPFADESVSQAQMEQPSMQELQPMDKPQDKPQEKPLDKAGSPPAYDGGYAEWARKDPSPGGSPKNSPKNIDAREAELQRREQDLIKREAAVRRREQTSREQGTDGETNNWPFPPYWKLAFHSIPSEIPAEYKRNCRLFYMLWIVNVILLVYNFFLILILYFAGALSEESSPTLEVLFAFIYMFLGCMCSWRWWYRDIYFAFRDSKTRKWLSFFITFSLHILWNVFMLLGVPGTAAAGLILMLDTFSKSDTSSGWGVAMLVSVLVAGIILVCSVFLIKIAHRIYTSDGHSRKAKKEVTREIGKAALESQMNDGRV